VFGRATIMLGIGPHSSYECTDGENYRSADFTVLLLAGAAGKPVGNGEDEGRNWKEEDSTAA